MIYDVKIQKVWKWPIVGGRLSNLKWSFGTSFTLFIENLNLATLMFSVLEEGLVQSYGGGGGGH